MRTATKGIDYTSRDYQAYKDLLISKLQEKMPEYTDTSETDAGIVILEALANGLDICSYYADAIANDVILATTQDRQIATLLARDLGYIPYNQTSSVIPMVFTLEVEQEEDITIDKGTVVTTEDSDGVEAIPFETLSDLVIPAGKLGNETDEEGNYLYTVLAKQGETVEDDYIGSSNGTPYQTFQLSYTEVLVDTLEVYVDEGDGEILWTKVNNFQDSDSTSRVYTVSVDEYDDCFINFGSGINGKIPAIFDNGIRVNYKTGGGMASNVRENTVTVLETEVAYVDSCFNLEPVVYGHAKESIEEIRYNAPAYNRTRDRAVTLQDYEDLLNTGVNDHDSFYGIFNTKAIRNLENGLVVDLYYQMRDGYEMTEELTEELSSFFEPRTMIGTSYTLLPYVANEVNLNCTLIVNQDYVAEEVENDVKAYIDNYFSGNSFTFGDELVKSELEDEIRTTLEGVRSFRINTPTGDIIQSNNPYEIITLGTLDISTSGGDI